MYHSFLQKHTKKHIKPIIAEILKMERIMAKGLMLANQRFMYVWFPQIGLILRFLLQIFFMPRAKLCFTIR